MPLVRQTAISGIPAETFQPITGDLDERENSTADTSHDADILAQIDLERFYNAENDAARLVAVKPLIDYR